MTLTSQTPAPIGPHTIRRYTLSNGIQLIIQENHVSPSVVVRGHLWAGGIDDLVEKLGLSHFTASALARGTTSRSFTEINDLIESAGANLYVSGGRHLTQFGGKCLAEDLELLVDLLADVLRRPAFPEIELDKIRDQMMTGLRETENSTHSQTNRLFRNLIYPTAHPYSYSLSGTLETVPEITSSDIGNFFQSHYYADGVVIVVVGDVQADAVKDLLARYFQDWSAQRPGQVTPIPVVEGVTATKREIKTMAGKSQSDLALGFMGPARTSPDFYAAQLGNIVLGQLGLGGRLGESVRETHGLAYYVHASLGAATTPSPWSISAGVNKTNVQKAIELIMAELDRFIREPIPTQELEDAKSYVTGVLPLQLERNEGIAGTLLYMERHQLGDDYIMRYPDLIRAIGADEVLAAAQSYIQPEKAIIAIAGDYADGDGQQADQAAK